MIPAFKFILILAALAALAASSCHQPQIAIEQFEKVDQKFKMTDLKINTSRFIPLAWEKKGSYFSTWSMMTYSIISNEEINLITEKNIADIHEYCSGYKLLNSLEKINFWGQFIAALAFSESSWNPRSQRVESTMGTDPVTSQQIMSEGLLQLSYQDEKNYRIDCGFNWEKDQLLVLNHPGRSILDPFQNLRCGIKIISLRLKKYHSIQVPDKNVYWSVLRRNSKSNALIKKTTQSLPFCLLTSKN